MKDISLNIEDVKLNVRVGLIMEKGNKVFIDYHPSGRTSTTIPGGRIQTMESSKEALKREIQEEMHFNLDLDKITLKAILENFFEVEKTKVHEYYFIYKLKLDENDNRFPDNMKNYDSEDGFYKWIEKDHLNEVNLLPVELIDLIQTDEFEHQIIK